MPRLQTWGWRAWHSGPFAELGSLPVLLMVPGKQMASDLETDSAGLPQYSLLFSVTESLVLFRTTTLLSLYAGPTVKSAAPHGHRS